MKKLLTMMLCAIVFSACSNDDDEQVIDYANLLVGQWVYDHPEEGVWETIKFTSSGMFYYSNSNEILYEFENENVNGRYFVDGNLVTGTYTLNDFTQMNLDMQITKINDLEFTAKFNDTGLTFTYARLLDTEIVNYQEIVLPDYAGLIGGRTITAYTSHNSNIAKVDAATGEITGVSSGRTYIDVVTSDGTAVIEIIVKGILPYNFDEFIGVEKSVIYETFGTNPAGEEEDVIVYQNLTNEIKYLRVGFDLLTGTVSSIRLYLTDNVPADYISSMTGYLEKLYTVYEKGTTDTYKAYINHQNFDNASVGITWDIPNMQVTYVALTHDLFTDYSPFLGKTQTEVKAMMKDYEPFKEDSYQLVYGISKENVELVCCYYTFDFVNTYETAQAVIIQLSSSLASDDVEAYLAKKYKYLDSESTTSEKVYLTKDGLIAVFYNIEYGQVSYFSNVTSTKSVCSIKELNRHFVKSK